MQQFGRGKSIFTRIVGHDFSGIGRSYSGGLVGVDSLLTRLKWTKTLKTFFLLNRVGANSKLSNILFPTGTINVTPFVLPGRGRVYHSFYKSLSSQIILNRAIYFHGSVFSFRNYAVIKFVANLLFVLIFFVIFFVVLTPFIWFSDLSLICLWAEELLLVDAAWGDAAVQLKQIYLRCLGFGNVWNYALLGAVVDPVSLLFSPNNVSFFFQDFELFFSFTDFFSAISGGVYYAESNLLHELGYSLLMGLLIYALLFFYWLRANGRDFWVYFFNLAYCANWLNRLGSLEPLYQMLNTRVVRGGRLLDRELFKFVLNPRAVLPAYSRQTVAYYFSQTVGGRAGFLDLFPSTSSYLSENTLAGKNLKTPRYIKLVGTYLREKVNEQIPFAAEFKIFNSSAHTSIRTSLFWHARPVFNYLGNFIPGVKINKFQFYFGEYFSVVSSLGDRAAARIQANWFTSTFVRNYGFWFISFLSREKNGDSAGVVSSEASKFSLYRREVNTYAVRNRLLLSFRNNTFLRFKIGYQSVVNDFSFWRYEGNLEGGSEYFSNWDGFADDNSFAVSAFQKSKFSQFEPTVSLASFSSNENDVEDSDHLDFTDSFTETYFEDNLLQKDVPLVFFDDLLAEKVRQSRIMPDEDGLSYYKTEEFEDIGSSEYLTYGAGQEADLLSRTSSSDYSGLYTKDYSGSLHYNENCASSIYDDLADYWALHSATMLFHITLIPAGRIPFWGGVFNTQKSRHNWNFRKRMGRVLYFYWNTFSGAMTTNYFPAWSSEIGYIFGFSLALALVICYGYDFSENNFFMLLLSLCAIAFLVLWFVCVGALIGEMKQHAVFLKLNLTNLLFKRGDGVRGMLKHRILVERLVSGFVAEQHAQYPATAFLACSKLNSADAAQDAFLWTNSNQFFLSVGRIVVTPSFVVGKIFENAKLDSLVNYQLGSSHSLAGDLFGVRYNFFSRCIPGLVGGLYFSRGFYAFEWGNAVSLETNLIGDLSLELNACGTVGLEFGSLSYDYLTEDYRRFCWKKALTSEAYSSLTVSDAFNKYYWKRAPTLDFYPTLSSQSAYWALLWAKTIFAGAAWPQTADCGRSLFGDITISHNSSSLIRGKFGFSGGVVARNTRRFFNFFQVQDSLKEVSGGFAFTANAVRVLTFKRSLLQFFFFSSRSLLVTNAGGALYRTHVRYTPYRPSLSTFVRR